MTSTPTSNFNWDEVFSAENKARTIEYLRLNRKNSYTFPTDDPNFKKAAVLIPLCYDTLGRPSILYNLRSLNLSNHGGEISFPGGKMEPGDNNSIIVTALRETEEELGLNRDKVEVWTTLRDFQTISSAMGVTPVLGFVHGWKKLDPTKLKVNPGEVDHAFTVTLEHLCDPRNWADMEKMNFPLSIYKNLDVQSESQTVDLWGLTAIITHETLEALLPNVYMRSDSFLDPFNNKANSQL